MVLMDMAQHSCLLLLLLWLDEYAQCLLLPETVSSESKQDEYVTY